MHPTLLRKAAVTVAVTVLLVVGLGILPGATAPVTKAIAENYTFYK